ncbi:metallophosphoesterase [Nocardioides sp.]|uniref:metallophosphoesterase n=1 Tax=Nocardioides sp. TaxID=35761 RepID=UPI0019B15EBF|nr:metallophosphoesterase [Nocardioides sp.]MBC7279059.1 metallophosphoesterase [Nocardioides sp.]
MTTWFTSDLHFGHARLLELSAGRGTAFASVEEMNETLVANWNSVVESAEDVVWVLGDFDMHGKDASLALVSRLNGTKVLVSGNHDACWAGMRDGWKHRSRYLEAGFAAVMDFAVTKLPPLGPEASATRVLLSHFPYAGDSHDKDRYEQFRLRDEGVPLLHGHVHEAFRERRTAKGTWGINVGVDHWGHRPVSAETLARHLDELSRTAG